MFDLVYVKTKHFSAANICNSREIENEISFQRGGQKLLLVGPGRWGCQTRGWGFGQMGPHKQAR